MVHTAQNSSEVGSFKQHSSSSTGSSGQETLPFHPEADDLGLQFLQGLPHSWPDGQQAINKGKYNQWIAAKSAVTMADLPDTSAYEPPDNDRHPDYRPTRTHTITTTNRWYDVSITTNDTTYLRRLAGHVETGTPASATPPSAPPELM
ncbi:hypothetical protein AB0H36_02580 [Kribbella sp. NPDC050820]|uniref:hypothetical protein n=1 Tax=Kribbella sp. NPDC050820 TaxID=3155408 RepID=UPI0033C56524